MGSRRQRRQFDECTQPAFVPVPERDIAAMFARDAEAKTNACFGWIARRLPPIERCENLLLLLGQNAGPVVFDDDGDPTHIANDVDAYAPPYLMA